MNTSSETEQKSSLPASWAWAGFDKCVETVSDAGRRLSQSEYESSGRFPVVDQGSSFIGGYTDDESLLFVGELPVIAFGDHTRRVKLLGQPFVVGAQGLKLFRPRPGLDARYLAHWLSVAPVADRGYSRHFQYLRKIPIPVAPLAEQRRIVATLEEHLSGLDAAVAGLERAKANLERYREALRDAAASGRLLGDADSGSYRQEAQIPDGWEWSKVGKCAAPEPNAISDGPFGSKLKTEHYVDEGPRVIRLQNIGRGKFIDAKAHISIQHFATLQKHRVYAGDVVIAALGETLPRACAIPADLGPAIVKADCIRFKPDPTVLLSAYAGVALNADSTRRRVTAAIHGVGRPRLNLGEIREIAFLLPPLEVQRRIVETLEGCFAVADRTAADIDVQLARAARLRQSILKRAFEGKLVLQAPSDESAADLLARLRNTPNEVPPRSTRSAPKRATARRGSN